MNGGLHASVCFGDHRTSWHTKSWHAGNCHDTLAHDMLAHDKLAHDKLAHDKLAHDKLAPDNREVPFFSCFPPSEGSKVVGRASLNGGPKAWRSRKATKNRWHDEILIIIQVLIVFFETARARIWDQKGGKIAQPP